MCRIVKVVLIVVFLGSAIAAQQSRPEERREERRERRRRRREHHRAVQPRATQLWSGILDPARAMDWTHAGVQIRSSTHSLCDWSGQYSDCVSGIPTDRTQCVPNDPRISAGDVQPNGTLMPHGGTDITDATNINAAIQSCPANTYLLLGPGTFYIVLGLTFGGPGNSNGFTTAKSFVTLRGSGPEKTTLKFTSLGNQTENGYAVSIGISGNSDAGTISYAGSCAVTSGYTQGSTQLTLGNCYNNIPPDPNGKGKFIALDQRVDDVGLLGCTSSGTTATCTVSTSTLPPGFVAGPTHCVGVGGVGGTGALTGYNAAMWSPQANPTTCNAITATSGNTFSYTMPSGASNLAPVGPQCYPSGATVATGINTICGFATVDTGGAYMTGVYCVTADGNCPSLTGGLEDGRVCPDVTAVVNPACQPGEISWRSQSQTLRVLSVTPAGCTNNCTITVDMPIFASNWRPSQAPGIWWVSLWMEGDAVENVTLDTSDDGGTSTNMTILLQHCHNCWIRNIRSISGPRNHIWLHNGDKNVTVRDSYFFDTKRGASQSYGVEVFQQTSDVLIENNIFIRVVAGIMNAGAFGDVEGYNYLRDDGYNSTYTLMQMLNSNHSVSQYTLMESNNAPAPLYDNIHGTASAMTSFRERDRGQSIPRKTNNLNPYGITSYTRGVNYIGGVLGTAGVQTYRYQVLGGGKPAQCATSVWCMGMTSQNGNQIPDDPLAWQTLMRWGNYDVITGATRWCATGNETGCSVACPPSSTCSELPGTYPYLGSLLVPSSHTLPPSFYLTAKPVWYGTKWGTPPWPSIGPDVTGGNAPDGTCGYVPVTPPFNCTDAGSGMAYRIPAQLVQENMPLDPAYLTSNTVTGATWALTSTGYLVDAQVTLTGTFHMPVFGTFQLAGMTPATYNGLFQIFSLDGPTSDPGSNVSVVAGTGMLSGSYQVATTRVNSVGGVAGETGKSGVTRTYIGTTCPSSGSCQLQVSSPCSTNASGSTCFQDGVPLRNPNATSGYNVYIFSYSDPTGKFCRQNSSPIALGTAYVQSTPAILGSDLNCIQPPAVSTAISTVAKAIMPYDPGAATATTVGTVTAPLVQIFNADQYYYGAAPPPTITPPGITGHGKITGNGKIT